MDDTIGFPDPGLDLSDGFKPHTSHWGVFSARQGEAGSRSGRIPAIPIRTASSRIFPAPCAIARASRSRWCAAAGSKTDPGPDDRRGRDEFVPLSWEKALDLLGAELARVRDTSRPGRRVRRLLWLVERGPLPPRAKPGPPLPERRHGRLRASRSTPIAPARPRCWCRTSSATTRTSTKRNVILGADRRAQRDRARLRRHGAEEQHGGRRRRSASMSSAARWRAPPRAAASSCLVSPLRADLPDEAGAEWISMHPRHRHRADAGIVHTLVVEGLHDRAFLDRYTVGWPVFERYLLGETDGQPKDAAWAAAITRRRRRHHRGAGAPARTARRALIVVSHSLQRAEHGEQPVWMGVVLAAALGQIGLPGGGYAYALGAIALLRPARTTPCRCRRCRRAATASRDFIPVARIADMLLNPGSTYRYNGETRTYPDIRLVYWAGGNPFHHHQDLNRLRKAFAQVDTLVVHELAWTATARHADFVLPCDHDAGARGYRQSTPTIPCWSPMHRIAAPFGRGARRLRDLRRSRRTPRRARSLHRRPHVRQWLEHLYEPTRAGARGRAACRRRASTSSGRRGSLVVPQQPDDGGRLRRFREDPDGTPLPTPSGKHRDLLGEDRGLWRCGLSRPSGLARASPTWPDAGGAAASWSPTSR